MTGNAILGDAVVGLGRLRASLREGSSTGVSLSPVNAMQCCAGGNKNGRPPQVATWRIFVRCCACSGTVRGLAVGIQLGGRSCPRIPILQLRFPFSSISVDSGAVAASGTDTLSTIHFPSYHTSSPNGRALLHSDDLLSTPPPPHSHRCHSLAHQSHTGILPRHRQHHRLSRWEDTRQPCPNAMPTPWRVSHLRIPITHG